jgi:hypothetical protein
MKKHTQDLIAKLPRGCSQVGITIGMDLGMSGAITARSTKMVKLSTGAVPNEPIQCR